MTRDSRARGPECSVVIATHQRLDMLKMALGCALQQVNVDLEVLVVENGSTDGTVEYLRGLTDSRVKPLVFKDPIGSTRARNEGLNAARGEWVCLIDDDDLWAPEKLSAELAAARQSGSDWVYAGAVIIDGPGEIMTGAPPPSPSDVAKNLPLRYVIPGGFSSILWRRTALDGDGLLDGRLTYHVDWDVSQRLLRRGLPAVVNRPLVAWRYHGANMSARARAFLGELPLMEEKFADLRKGRPIDRGFLYRMIGTVELRSGNRGAALSWYAKALQQGDFGALLRAAVVPLPATWLPRLHKLALTDDAWSTDARAWLAQYVEGATVPT